MPASCPVCSEPLREGDTLAVREGIVVHAGCAARGAGERPRCAICGRKVEKGEPELREGRIVAHAACYERKIGLREREER